MTPSPTIDNGAALCSHRCPAWRGSWCVLAGRWTHHEARCPVVRVMTEEEAARVAVEDDSVREMRRRMGR